MSPVIDFLDFVTLRLKVLITSRSLFLNPLSVDLGLSPSSFLNMWSKVFRLSYVSENSLSDTCCFALSTTRVTEFLKKFLFPLVRFGCLSESKVI